MTGTRSEFPKDAYANDAYQFIRDLVHMQRGSGWTRAAVREAAADFLRERGLDTGPAVNSTPRFIGPLETLRAEMETRIKAAVEAERTKYKIVYIYDADDWEETFQIEDKNVLVEGYDLLLKDEPKRFGTLIQGPALWAARVVTSVDNDGDPDETEVRWFDSKEAAIRARSQEVK